MIDSANGCRENQISGLLRVPLHRRYWYNASSNASAPTAPKRRRSCRESLKTSAFRCRRRCGLLKSQVDSSWLSVVLSSRCCWFSEMGYIAPLTGSISASCLRGIKPAGNLHPHLCSHEVLPSAKHLHRICQLLGFHLSR